MNKLKILHISDLHCSEDDSKKGIGHIKKGVKREHYGEFIYKNSRELFLNRLTDFNKIKIDAIACTGDLGDGGKLDQTISLGINFLTELADRLKIKREYVVISPGNHDLNRDANDGSELKKFESLCKSAKFTYAKRKTPAFLVINQIPIIAINSCLGQTEPPIPSELQKYWVSVKKDIKKIVSPKKAILKDMSDFARLELQDTIPAIGITQFESIRNYLATNDSSFAIILSHHNPFPTPNTDVRPYSNIIDSGEFISGFMNKARQIILLHGHTHCDSTITSYVPESNEKGYIIAIGTKGLLGADRGGSTATLIDLNVSGAKYFLSARVSRFIQNGHDYRRDSFDLYDDLSNNAKPFTLLDKMEKNKKYSLIEFAKLSGEKIDDTLAESLLLNRRKNVLEIDGIDRNPEDWNIIKVN